jgi:putative transposase
VDDLELMRRIDELFTAWPFLGSRRMARMGSVQILSHI